MYYRQEAGIGLFHGSEERKKEKIYPTTESIMLSSDLVRQVLQRRIAVNEDEARV